MSYIVVSILLCLLWLQLAWLETQREDQLASSLVLKAVLVVFMAFVIKQMMHLMQSAVDRSIGSDRVQLFIRRMIISCAAVYTVNGLLNYTDVISRPIYLPQLADVYIPDPIAFRMEEDDLLMVPGYVTLRDLGETNRLYQHYISSPHNDANTIQAGILKIGKDNFCVTNPISFSESDNFTCQGPRCLQYLQNCMANPNKTFSIIPLTFRAETRGGSNELSLINESSASESSRPSIQNPILNAVMVVNHIRKEIELYDANGLLVENTPQYERMLAAISRMANLQNYEFLGQLSFGFGMLQEIRNGKYKGLDSLYIYWYLETRFLNPELTPQMLDEKLVLFVQRHPDAVLQYLKPRISLITGTPIQYPSYSVMSEEHSAEMIRMTSNFEPSMFHDYQRKKRLILQQLIQNTDNNLVVDYELLSLARKELRKVEMEIDRIDREESWVVPVLDSVNKVYSQIRHVHTKQSPILIGWLSELLDSWDLQGFNTLESDENFPSWPLLLNWENLEQYWRKEKGLAVADFFHMPIDVQVQQARLYLAQKMTLLQKRDNELLTSGQIAPRTAISQNSDLKLQLSKRVETMEQFTRQYRKTVALIEHEIDYFEKHGKSTEAFQILRREKLRELQNAVEAFNNQ